MRAGEVLVIDPTTGRVAPGRSWSLGLHQAIAHEQGAGDPRLHRLFVLTADHEPVHDRIYVLHLRFVKFDLR